MAGLTQGVAVSRRDKECVGERLEERAGATTPDRRTIRFGASLRSERSNGDWSRECPVDDGLEPLVRTIESEIIPRLMLAWRPPPGAGSCARAQAVPDSEDVAAFAGLVLAHDTRMAQDFIETLRLRGVSLEAICLDLLAPTARYLGDLWIEDLCDFSQVTVGLCCLHRVLHGFSADFQRESRQHETGQREHGRRALLLPVPGEQHSFGLLMVTEFFRRAGWDVRSGLTSTNDELVHMVRGEWFAVVGLSLSGDRHLDTLTALIAAIRRHSRNRTVGIMVGGALFIEHPELVSRVGADATATDGQQAAMQAENLLALLLHC
jgi:MerR family transcriptional regulator, light-induced transcriptional regulator